MAHLPAPPPLRQDYARPYQAPMDALPIDAALPDLLAAITARGLAVLQAPPGSGKTTRVPLALLPHIPGRIVMLEPRRIAARAAAARMADSLGETVGGTVGYRMRGESRPGSRIEVVTEGLFTRLIQADPDLPGIGAVLFDEFHERSLQGDLGLAFALESRATLRPDLVLVAMSATLDAAPVAALMGDAPVINAPGQAFPVEIRYLDRPLPPTARIADEVARAILSLLPATTGGLLAFLPGEGEIRRALAALTPHLPADVQAMALYGALPLADQAHVLRPLTTGRKLVLATAIAETSLTIPDIRVVVDAGLSRRARFDPGRGMSRLVTETVTRAEATQRAGRAGRVAPGLCLRLWTRGQDGAQSPFAPPEITVADLAPLALELAVWGGAALPFVTPPPPGPLAAARALLVDLGALDGDRVTPHGRAMATQALHPRLAHMALTAGQGAAPLASLLSDRDPLRGAGVDQDARLAAIARGDPRADAGALARLRVEARRIARGLPPDRGLSPAQMAALAYPDRVGQRRPGGDGRFLLSGGTGVQVPDGDPLAQVDYLVVTDSDGDPRQPRVRGGIAIALTDLRAVLASRITPIVACQWDARVGRVQCRKRRMLGALTLADELWPDAPTTAVTAAMLDGIRAQGLTLTGAAERLAVRVELLRAGGADMPDCSGPGLLADLDTWLAPWIGALRSADDWRRFDIYPALSARLTHAQTAALNQRAPQRLRTPLGREVVIEYSGGTPAVALRLQEVFGLTVHPLVGATPVRLTLLSPGGQPIAITTDLPGFWRGSYADVRRDMRGRYPRHPWPEDPTIADPTLRAKPRGT